MVQRLEVGKYLSAQQLLVVPKPGAEPEVVLSASNNHRLVSGIDHHYNRVGCCQS